MSLERDCADQLAEIASDITDPKCGLFEVPKADMARFVVAMAQDETDTFAIVHRATLNNLRDAAFLYRDVRKMRTPRGFLRLLFDKREPLSSP